MDITLSAEQKALLEIMEQTCQHLFITGRAGTGKSVLLRHFRENTQKKVVVAAPTGIAALNVRGQTLHSLFKLPPQLHRKGSLQPNARACMLLKRIDTLVIDEISMVRADLLDAVDERLREATKKDMPFGGVQVIMFGDVYQLPPVVEEGLMSYFEHVHGGYFFFHALAWKEAEFKLYELSEVFRQKDPTFKNILNAVRDGTVTNEQIAQLNARCAIPVPETGTLTLAPTNSLVTNINQRRLDQLEGKAYEYKAFITGEMKRSTFPTEEVIQLKVDAQVVLLQNDKDKRWVNGTVATISALTKDEKTEGITVKVDGIDYNLEQTTWEEIRYEYDAAKGKVTEEVVSSFTQYPIRLAWAMTIHKSQGQTYESVALDLTTATFAPGQLYVALSRCTDLAGLYLRVPIKRAHIIVEPKVTAFMSRREAIAIVEAVEEDFWLAPLEPVIAEKGEPVGLYTFFKRPMPQGDSNLIVAVNLSVKFEYPGGVSRQLYTSYEAIGCQYGADRGQVGEIHVAAYECDPARRVDEATARTIHPELFAYLDKESVQDTLTYHEDEVPPAVQAMMAVVQAEEIVAKSRRGRPASTEPTKKKDFRFPVALLEALKAVADESGTTDTQFIVDLLKSDPRIQQKLVKCEVSE